jgi:D-threo-aldose 1-dehydrogenase
MNAMSAGVLFGREIERTPVMLAAEAWRLGFGAAPIGNLYEPVSDLQARNAVREALRAGIRYFDTAPHYGFGLSESRLGAALAEFDPTGRAVVSTKVGRLLEPISTPNPQAVRHGFADAAPFEPVFDYGYDAVMTSWEQSRRRLGRERIDILLAHDLGALTHGDDHPRLFRQFVDGGYRAMRELRDAGAVGAIGLGVNEWQIAEEAIRELDLDIVLLAGRFTLLDQSAANSFLPLCEARGVKVIVGAPYNSGILAQGVDGRGRQSYDYKPASAEIVARVRRLEAICREFATPLAAAALQFPLSHRQVLSVIPGMASAREVTASHTALEWPIPEGLWEAIREEGLMEAPAQATPAARATVSQGPLMLLNPADNVLVCTRAIDAGDLVTIDGEAMISPDAIYVGHKVARRTLAAGEKVYKYGAPIGSMTAAAERGEHIHLHNMKSDYLATHTREDIDVGEGA